MQAPPPAPPPRPRPLWNIISLASPFVGLLLLGRHSGMGMGVGELASVVVGGGVGTLVGLAAAIVATVRKERLWGLTVAGFILNVPPLLLFLGLWICWRGC